MNHFRSVHALIDSVLAGSLTNLVASSYKDFHSKGLHYLCLKRDPRHTIKLYLLDGPTAKMPEVVNPHDHRYPFRTTVLKGQMSDTRYIKSPLFSSVYNAFDYLTPLNGGNGFTFRGEEKLRRAAVRELRQGQVLMTAPDDLHTIATRHEGTVIMLDQWGDVIDQNVPTSTWVKKGEPAPDTTGLYDRFSEGEFADLLKSIKQRLT